MTHELVKSTLVKSQVNFERNGVQFGFRLPYELVVADMERLRHHLPSVVDQITAIGNCLSLVQLIQIPTAREYVSKIMTSLSEFCKSTRSLSLFHMLLPLLHVTFVNNFMAQASNARNDGFAVGCAVMLSACNIERLWNDLNWLESVRATPAKAVNVPALTATVEE